MIPLKKPTKAQAKVLEFMRDQQTKFGAPPTLREICKHFGWTSSNSAMEHLRHLETKGFVKHHPGRVRGWVCL